MSKTMNSEQARIDEANSGKADWREWGPYLSERQWGTVREDYSKGGYFWSYFPHDHARSRAYRWGEDGLLGFCDVQCRLCFALALWNERDPILKERLFGLSNPEGNHGEDVKECYYYLDSTPTHSYCRALYKYPQAAFPYGPLVKVNHERDSTLPEFELPETGIFQEDRYFDVTVEYAKQSPKALLIRVIAENRGPDAAPLHLLPTLWFRNTWSWKAKAIDKTRPELRWTGAGEITAEHESLGLYRFAYWPGPAREWPQPLFTENETNYLKLYGVGPVGYAKDAFHEYLIHGNRLAVNPQQAGTKASLHYTLRLEPHAKQELWFALSSSSEPIPLETAPALIEKRRKEADQFYTELLEPRLDADAHRLCRDAFASLLWSKQFYYYVVEDWLQGDPGQPPPPTPDQRVRNQQWKHLCAEDVISMPDKWEYPWFAEWDLAFQSLVFSRIDPYFAKAQLLLLLQERYLHPLGQIPSCEPGFSNNNPPIQAATAWQIYIEHSSQGRPDVSFLQMVFDKLLINFTWWINKRDRSSNHIFSGGFLGLDNISVINRTGMKSGMQLEQADATGWMASYCLLMLRIALELSHTLDQDKNFHTYEELALRFFQQFIEIGQAINQPQTEGLWDEEDGFYYDRVKQGSGATRALKVRSLVGLLPLCSIITIQESLLEKIPRFRHRALWLRSRHPQRFASLTCRLAPEETMSGHCLFAMLSPERLRRILKYVLDEQEFLSPYGIRSLSKYHQAHPYVLEIEGRRQSIEYLPAYDRNPRVNSNWRGPVWFPVNYLIIHSLLAYHEYFGPKFRVECPIGSGQELDLREVALEIRRRLLSLFAQGPQGVRHSHPPQFPDPALPLFHEFFDAETGAGLGAQHQTGWTALVSLLAEEQARTNEFFEKGGGKR